MRMSLQLFALAAVAFLLSPQVLADVVDVRVVVLEDDVAPDGPPNLLFSSGAGLHVNSTGQVGFETQLYFNPLGTGRPRAAFSEATGTLRKVLQYGDQAAGSPPGVTHTNFINYTFSDGGHSAVRGVLSNGDDTIHTEHAGLVQRALGTNDPAPDATDGAVVLDLDRDFTMNASGQILTQALLGGPGVTTLNDMGLYKGTPGSMSKVAREFDVAGSIAPDVRFQNFFDDPRINDAGQAAFIANLADERGLIPDDQAVFIETPTGLTHVARVAETIPAEPGVTIKSFIGGPAFNNSAAVAFTAELDNPTPTTIEKGIFSTQSGALELVKRTGDFDGLNNLDDTPAMNNLGQTAFRGFIESPGPTEPITIMYSEGSGALEEIARSGTQAPGADPGIEFLAIRPPAINDRGQIAFAALVGNVTTEPYEALFATDPSGDLVKIVAAGDQIDVNDDPLIEDLRTVDRIFFHGPTGFSDIGHIGYSVRFTDSQDAAVVSSAVVPEPCTLALLTVGTACLRWTRRGA